MGWLLVLGLKEGLVECATLCVKSEVILMNIAVKCSIQRYLETKAYNESWETQLTSLTAWAQPDF